MIRGQISGSVMTSGVANHGANGGMTRRWRRRQEVLTCDTASTCRLTRRMTREAYTSPTLIGSDITQLSRGISNVRQGILTHRSRRLELSIAHVGKQVWKTACAAERRENNITVFGGLWLYRDYPTRWRTDLCGTISAAAWQCERQCLWLSA